MSAQPEQHADMYCGSIYWKTISRMGPRVPMRMPVTRVSNSRVPLDDVVFEYMQTAPWHPMIGIWASRQDSDIEKFVDLGEAADDVRMQALGIRREYATLEIDFRKKGFWSAESSARRQVLERMISMQLAGREMVAPAPRRKIAEGQGREGSEERPIVARGGMTLEQSVKVAGMQRDVDKQIEWAAGAEDAELKAMLEGNKAAIARSAGRTAEEPTVPTFIGSLPELVKKVYSAPVMKKEPSFMFPVQGPSASSQVDRERAQAARPPEPEPARTVSTRRFQNLDFGDDE